MKIMKYLIAFIIIIFSVKSYFNSSAENGVFFIEKPDVIYKANDYLKSNIAVVSIMPTELHLFSKEGLDPVSSRLPQNFLFNELFMVSGDEYHALVGSKNILFINNKMEGVYFIDIGDFVKKIIPENFIPDQFRIMGAAWDGDKFICSIRAFDGSFFDNPQFTGLELSMTPGHDDISYNLSRPLNKSLSLKINLTNLEENIYNVTDFRIYGSGIIACLSYSDHRDIVLAKLANRGVSYFDVYNGHLLAKNHLKFLIFTFDPLTYHNRIENLYLLHEEKGKVRYSVFNSDTKSWYLLVDKNKGLYSFIVISFLNDEIQRKEFKFRLADGYVSGMNFESPSNRVIMPVSRNFNRDVKNLVYFISMDLEKFESKFVGYEVKPDLITNFLVF